MKDINRKNLMMVAIIGSIVIALIIVVGTVWTGRSASGDTETAVRNVSLLYLDELAGRREQVVASTLSDYISDLDVAVGLITSDDLGSVESLQAYQLRMKQLYGLEKFAFVDETGLIYTSRGTRTDIDQYDFDYQTLSAPEISVKNADSDSPKIVVAMPTDSLAFEGHTLVVCFMEMDMNKMIQNISLQSGSNNTTFCNLYTSDGYSLTNAVLGGLASEDNLLSALENATFEDGYSIDMIRSDFSSERTGVVSFTYNNITETMYYVPVERTDWMLTYLIRESVISAQIDTISDGIIRRSMILAVLITVVLASVFIMMLIQVRRTTKLTIEKKLSEDMQQELEERIALQDELLDQEKKRAQLDSMITALASDYRSVYYVNLDTDDAVCYRSGGFEDKIAQNDSFVFSEEFGRYAIEHVTDEYREQFLEFIKPENIRRALGENIIIAFRYLVSKGGNERYEMLRMADVNRDSEDDDGSVHAVGVGFTDIDEEMRDSLAKNEALSDALKAAEEANKAKTAFLSSMSHEIRTPMNAIIGLDSIALKDDDIPQQTREYLTKIDGSARHLLNLINDILDVSRIESGRMNLRNEEFSFREMLEQINTMINGQCRDKGLTYDCHITGLVDDYYIGDVMKLKQVIINILGNSVKFTPEGGKVSFEVEQVSHFEDKATMRFTMKDTGIGMDKEYLPKIFDPFSQEDSSRSNKYGSTGLGMAITKNIVEMMNGDISVESTKGEGTTFTVTVTLKKTNKVVETVGNIHPQDMHVLVIDDDPIACEHARLVLEEVGIAADTAIGPDEALEKVKLCHIRQQDYNLILVDWKMPERDGIEVTRDIRDIVGDSSAIIILTAYSWDDVIDEALDAGVDGFMSKPLFATGVMDEFKSAIRKKNIDGAKRKHNTDIDGRHILLAEDININAEITEMLLKMRGVKTDHAENGRRALEMFEESREGYYDAILMDVRMPVMDGLDATQKIRALERADAKKIPIIAMTANAFDEDVQLSLQAGMDAHLSKPVDADHLYETLAAMIKDDEGHSSD